MCTNLVNTLMICSVTLSEGKPNTHKFHLVTDALLALAYERPLMTYTRSRMVNTHTKIY